MAEASKSASIAARARWLEIAVSVGASIVTGAIVTLTTLSGTLAKFEEKLTAHQQRLAILEEDGRAARTERSTQGAAIAVQATQWAEVVRRLESIDRKLEQIK